MARAPHGFWLANLAVAWAAFFAAWAMFGSAYSSGESVLEENPDATVLAWLLVAFAVITGFSIGLFVLPVAIALVAAAALTPVA
jgi:hypothetical protein